jgi:hypothetical protein
MLVKIPSPFDDFGFHALSFLVNAGTKFGLTEGSGCYKEEGKDEFFHGLNVEWYDLIRFDLMLIRISPLIRQVSVVWYINLA